MASGRDKGIAKMACERRTLISAGSELIPDTRGLA